MLIIQNTFFSEKERKPRPPKDTYYQQEYSSVSRQTVSQIVDIPDWLLFVLAIFLPPLAVYLKKGARMSFWINVVLTFFFLPGTLHALLIVFWSRTKLI